MIVTQKAKQAEFEIKPDTKVLLVIETKSGVEGITNRISLNSYVEEVLPDGCLLIQAPVHRGYNYPLPRDEPIFTYLLTKTRMFSMTVRLMGHTRRDGLLYAKVRMCSPVESDQRRDCYRLPCELPVLVKPQKACKNKTSKTEQTAAHECKTIDLSDGGMMFATNGAYEIGEKISLAFSIGTDETITAEVLRIERIERPERVYIEPSASMPNAESDTADTSDASGLSKLSESCTAEETTERLGTANKSAYRKKVAVKFIHKCQKQKNRFYKFIVEQQLKNMKEQAEHEANHTASRQADK